ncbi:MAG: hypothetical protein WCC89_19345, partial [Candidatus Sulfotelmatobacter sp.]
MIARIDMGNAKRKTPQARLAIALPLVCGGPAGTATGAPPNAVVAGAADASLPQILQNRSPTATLFPHPEQNTPPYLPEQSRQDFVEID